MTTYLYILLCTDHTTYTGITSDPIRRFLEHRHRPSHYMKLHTPTRLLYIQAYPDRRTAALAEQTVKRIGAWHFLKSLYTRAGIPLPAQLHPQRNFASTQKNHPTS